jgi:3-deoxy-alpha-D-manno-octulosonate 8-oxidase
MYRNYKAIDRLLYGRGCFAQLDAILGLKRTDIQPHVVFLVDDVFRSKPLLKRIPVRPQDQLIFVSAKDEPKTGQIDALVREIKQFSGNHPAALVSIGGGTVMDCGKATALMVTNPGLAQDYQGLDLIRHPGVYSVVVPTISGTGAEVSMTAVLTGPVKKLGIKCDWTVPDQVVLDPDLIADVPNPQRFYTGMDSYIHAVEALDGTWRNVMGDAFGVKSLELCREVFLRTDIRREDADEKLMVASYMGGLSLTYSQVGVCHALSYGLSFALDIHHGEANCIAFNVLQEYYPEGVKEFHHMLELHHIHLRRGVAHDMSEAEMDAMIDVAWALDHMWDHALGKNWKEKITREKIKALYLAM